MSEQPPQRNAQEALAAMLKEQQKTNKLLRPISTLAQIGLILLIIAVLLGIAAFVFNLILG